VSFSVVRFGVDDMTLGFDLSGLRKAAAVLEDMPGAERVGGKMLGYRTKWGSWAHPLGRSVAIWKPESTRLYVQAKLALEGELCPPKELRAATDRLVAQLGAMGLASWQEPWVTRLDVAVDASCEPAEGKLLLDGLEACRPPNGWRTSTAGTPRSTVYFRAARSEKVVARAYCRNLKLRQGEPFGLIRLEAQQRWQPRVTLLATAVSPPFAAHLWRSRFEGLAARVIRVPADVQAMELGLRMKRGELDHGEFERLNAFLSLERQGIATECYRPSVYASRRREAARLGYGASDGKPALEIELGDLLRSYVEGVDLRLAA
jgi:hypothetical protein